MVDNQTRLRLYTARHRHKGTPESREWAITTFLSEVETVVSAAMIDNLSDDALGSLYVDWIEHVVAGTQAPDRQRWLVKGWPQPVRPFTRGHQLEQEEEPQAPPPSANVVTLDARAGR